MAAVRKEKMSKGLSRGSLLTLFRLTLKVMKERLRNQKKLEEEKRKRAERIAVGEVSKVHSQVTREETQPTKEAPQFLQQKQVNSSKEEIQKPSKEKQVKDETPSMKEESQSQVLPRVETRGESKIGKEESQPKEINPSILKVRSMLQ